MNHPSHGLPFLSKAQPQMQEEERKCVRSSAKWFGTHKYIMVTPYNLHEQRVNCLSPVHSTSIVEFSPGHSTFEFVLSMGRFDMRGQVSKYLLTLSVSVVVYLVSMEDSPSSLASSPGKSSLFLFAGRRKSGIVCIGNRFNAILIPKLSQHCTGWRSIAHVHSVLYLERTITRGVTVGIWGTKPPLPPPHGPKAIPPSSYCSQAIPPPLQMMV